MKATRQQVGSALLHATAWEHAADQLRKSTNGDPVALQRCMGVTIEQLRVSLLLADAVAFGYRRIVNGAEIDP